MNITLAAGQSVRITIEVIEAASQMEPPVVEVRQIGRKPGPKALPQPIAEPSAYFEPIQRLLSAGPKSAKELRDAFGVNSADNAFSWALVMLQNEGLRRGKNKRKTGPVQKLEDGRYQLRA